MPMSLARWPRCPRCGRFFANPDRETCDRGCAPPVPDRGVIVLMIDPARGGVVTVCQTFDEVHAALRAAAQQARP